MTEKHKCPPHHFILDSEGIGRCKYCPAVKNFGRLARKQEDRIQAKRSSGGHRGAKPHGKRGRPSKYV